MNDKPSNPEPSGAGIELDPEVQALLDGLDTTSGQPEAPAAGQIEAAPGSAAVAVAEREEQAPTEDKAKPAFRAPGNIRREHWWYLPFFGMLGALIVASAALTPSLLPRGGAVQGLVSGVGAALGYGVGLFILWLVRQFSRRSGPWYGNQIAWGILGIAGAVVLLLFVLNGKYQQDRLHEVVGLAPPGWTWYPIVVVTALIVFLLLVFIARGVRWIGFAVARLLGRFIPARTAMGIGIIVAGLFTFWAVDGVLLSGALSVTESVFKQTNSDTTEGTTQPDSASVSGSPESAVQWDDLGRKGRDFIAGVTPAGDLNSFSGGGAVDPIRVYVGLDSSTDAEERSALAVEDLKRFGAFDREVLAVGTTTGTGWVDETAVDPLEFMYNGDTAIVATQYSYLPSWVSFLVDQQRAKEAGVTLFDAVYGEWEKLPLDERPQLVVFGESLGSFGGEAAFSGLPDLANRTNGALFVGPPNSNELWSRYTQGRDEGTPEVLPEYREGEILRWAQFPDDLDEPPAQWEGTRVVYLQNASDPIVWWSPALLTDEPDWLREPRGRGVLETIDWYPLITFFQISADMMDSTNVPYGNGHVYQSHQAGAWVQIIPPQGWTDQDTDRLVDLVQANAG